MVKGIRILLVDSHELVRRGVRSMLEREEDMEIVADCSSVEEALSQMVRFRPDIVLMDIQLRGMNWIEAASRLRKSRPGADVDVIILAESLDYRDDALKAGATGYILKDIERMEFAEAIRKVYRHSHSLEEGDSPVEEVIELVIPPPAEATLLLRFMCQLGHILQDDFASIICTVGSWNKGTVITIRLHPTKPSDLAIELAYMPEVEKVEEQPQIKGGLSGFTNKVEFLPRLGVNPGRRLRVTLKETKAVSNVG